MLITFLVFMAICAGIAVAPRQATQFILVAAWVALAAGCVASVATTLAR